MGDIGQMFQAGASVADTAATDATNYQIMKSNQEFNAQQAALTRQFDASQQTNAQNFAKGQQLQAEQYNTQMSDTAMQRRVADLTKANLNPLLAISQGGASSPMMAGQSGPAIGGPAAQSVGLPDIRPLTSGLSGIADWNTKGKQAAYLDAQTGLVDAQTKKALAELPWSGPSAQAGYNNLVAERDRIFNEAALIKKQWNYTDANAANLWQNKDFQSQLQPLLIRAQSFDNQAKQYGLSQLRTESQYWDGPLAAGAYAGQMGSKTGWGGGWADRVFQGLQQYYRDKAGGSGDIGNPSP